jgi:hypothetical protein
MITAVSAAALEHKDLIIKLATQFRLPVVYAYRVFAAHGGLMSYATEANSAEMSAVGTEGELRPSIATAGIGGTSAVAARQAAREVLTLIVALL